MKEIASMCLINQKKRAQNGHNNNNNLSHVSGYSSKKEMYYRESLETISKEENNVCGTVESDACAEVDVQLIVEEKIEILVETTSVEVNAEVADGGINANMASSNNICGLDESLNFDNYNSPAELEVHIIVINF
jgi:hypothetical protein